MGMPISCYSTLLGVLRLEDYLVDRAEESLVPFSRFAFVIHDPESHRTFDKVLNDKFDDLDQFTGEHLLFFALIRPESADVEGLRNRPYYRVFEDKPWQVQELMSPDAIPMSPNPSMSAWAFSQALGIPFDALPCIVTTDDLLSPEIEVLRSAPETLERQLIDLGKAETRKRATRAGAGEQSRSTREYTKRLTGSLASTLAVVLGGIHMAAESRHAKGNEELYRDSFQRTLSELLEDLKQARRAVNVDDESVEQFEHLALTVAGVLQLLAEPSPSELPGLEEPLRSDLFDHETRIVLQTGLRCLRAIDEPRLLGGGLSRLDYSPSLLCFAKAFEKEMNLSVVHWVRQRLGISLPEYFNKVQRGASAMYSSARVDPPIDFNRGYGGAWKPPSLGQAELVFSECVNCIPTAQERPSPSGQMQLVFSERPGESVPGPFDRDTCARLMGSWQAIRSLRNQAAHDAIVARAECERVVSEFQRLIDTGVFQATTALRRALQGDPQTP